MFIKHLENAVEHFEVVEGTRIGRRVVGHKEIEENENKILDAEGEPVDGTPASVLGEDAGKQTRDEKAEHEAADDD